MDSGGVLGEDGDGKRGIELWILIFSSYIAKDHKEDTKDHKGKQRRDQESRKYVRNKLPSPTGGRPGWGRKNIEQKNIEQKNIECRMMNDEVKHRLARWFWPTAFFGWALVLVVLSIIPSSSLIDKSNDETNFRWDYVEHFGVFVVFGVLFGMWRRQKQENKMRAVFYFLILGIIYAASTEVLQIFVEGRTFNPVDMYMNLGGLFVGTLISYKYLIRVLDKQKIRVE